MNTYWNQTSEDLLQQLQATRAGLTPEEAQIRLKQVGPNSLKAGKKLTPLRIFLGQFNSPIIYILLFATAISAALQDWPPPRSSRPASA